MDDLVLRAAIRQDDHWTDRSALLDSGPQTSAGAATVVQLWNYRMGVLVVGLKENISFDRMVCFFSPSSSSTF